MNKHVKIIGQSFLKLFLTWLILFWFSFTMQAQKGVAVNISPTYARIDFHHHVLSGKHAYEIGMGSRYRTNINERPNIGQGYFFDASYHYRWLNFKQSNIFLGLGYRTPSVHNEGYISYGGLFAPITYTRYFFKESAAFRLRLSPYLGSDPEWLIPSLGFIYCF